MPEFKYNTIYLNGEALSNKDALCHIVDLLSESAMSDTPLSEDQLIAINNMADYLFTRLTEMDDLSTVLIDCCNGLTQGTHTSSGFALARILFTLGEFLKKQGDYRAINALVMFCSDMLFALYLHEPIYYRYITYAFYLVCGGHERIENKGYFDTIRYVERKRGYNGMEIDFMDMAAYYARVGLENESTPYGALGYYGMLSDIYNRFRAITDGISGRYTEGGAVTLYDDCMKKIRVTGGNLNPHVWAGAAYMVALHLGAYKKRMRVTRLYHKTEPPTDLDIEERKWAFKRLFAIIAILSTCALAILKVINFRASNPFRFYFAAGIAAFLFFFMILSLFGNRGNGRFMIFFNPWSGWGHGTGYFF